MNISLTNNQYMDYLRELKTQVIKEKSKNTPTVIERIESLEQNYTELNIKLDKILSVLTEDDFK